MSIPTLARAGALLALVGCAGSLESRHREDYREAADLRARESARAPAPLDGTLEGYVDRALRESPEVLARFERWHEATASISGPRVPPEPTVTVAHLFAEGQTRVGVMQAIPWPSRFGAGARAATHEARAAQEELAATVLALRARVTAAWLRLWLVGQIHAVRVEQDGILEDLAQGVRTRVELGAATVADLSQVQLRLERHHDHHRAHREERQMAEAELRALIGAAPGTRLPLRGAPPAPELPAESLEALHATARVHPRVRRSAAMSEAATAAAEREGASRLPSFMVGAEWMFGGPATHENARPPLMVSLGVQVPLWAGAYGDAQEAALARARGHESEARAQALRLEAEVEVALSRIRDTARRVGLYERTLVPQAEAVHASVVGSYQTGRASIAQILLATQELLELREQLAELRATHARAWAELEMVVGREVRRGR